MKLKRSAAVLAVILFGLAAMGCSGLTVKSDYDREYDFSKYKTYRWPLDSQVDPNDALQQDPLTAKRVKASIDEVLAAKGFTKVDTEECDFVVVTQAGVNERMRITNWGASYSGGWYDPWWGVHGGHTDVSYYEEGTLVIDIVDYGKKELAWRGMGTKTVQDYSDADKAQRAIDEAVRKILASFPPGGEQ